MSHDVASQLFTLFERLRNAVKRYARKARRGGECTNYGLAGAGCIGIVVGCGYSLSDPRIEILDCLPDSVEFKLIYNLPGKLAGDRFFIPFNATIANIEGKISITLDFLKNSRILQEYLEKASLHPVLRCGETRGHIRVVYYPNSSASVKCKTYNKEEVIKGPAADELILSLFRMIVDVLENPTIYVTKTEARRAPALDVVEEQQPLIVGEIVVPPGAGEKAEKLLEELVLSGEIVLADNIVMSETAVKRFLQLGAVLIPAEPTPKDIEAASKKKLWKVRTVSMEEVGDTERMFIETLQNAAEWSTRKDGLGASIGKLLHLLSVAAAKAFQGEKSVADTMPDPFAVIGCIGDLVEYSYPARGSLPRIELDIHTCIYRDSHLTAIFKIYTTSQKPTAIVALSMSAELSPENKQVKMYPPDRIKISIYLHEKDTEYVLQNLRLFCLKTSSPDACAKDPLLKIGKDIIYAHKLHFISELITKTTELLRRVLGELTAREEPQARKEKRAVQA